MDKPIVFLSHITEEKELAHEIKELITSNFLGMLEVFVSSDDESISSGGRWLENITDALTKCSIELILCSPQSIKRPWINFEAGAGWIRKIPVIPICHSGMEPTNLPIPLNMLQSVKVTDEERLKSIFPVLAGAIGSKTPNIPLSEFIAKVNKFEENYNFWHGFNNDCKTVYNICTYLYEDVRSKDKMYLELTDKEAELLEKSTKFLVQKDLLKIEKLGNSVFSESGLRWGYNIYSSNKMREFMKSPSFSINKKSNE